MTYLLNNPGLNISGVILSAPFLGFHENKKMGEAKKLAIRLLAPVLEVR